VAIICGIFLCGLGTVFKTYARRRLLGSGTNSVIFQLMTGSLVGILAWCGQKCHVIDFVANAEVSLVAEIKVAEIELAVNEEEEDFCPWVEMDEKRGQSGPQDYANSESWAPWCATLGA